MNRHLMQQGYSSCSLEELKRLDFQVRLVPAFYLATVLTGLILHQPLIPFFLCLLAIGGFISSKGHPLDLLTHKLASLLNYSPPPLTNPGPRRYASLVTACLSLAVGILLFYQLTTAAWAVGMVLITLQAVLLLTHFCFVCWLYEKLYKFFGSEDVISLSEARKLRMQGALLLDVRTPQEYLDKRITGAVNIPLPMIKERTEFHGKQVIVFCNSGIHSKDAVDLINREGLAEAHCLGPIENAILL